MLPRLTLKVIYAILPVNAVRAALSIMWATHSLIDVPPFVCTHRTTVCSFFQVSAPPQTTLVLALEDRMASAAANRAELGQKLTNAVLASISRDEYSVDPPKLSPELWDRVCVLTPGAVAENERLEFLGDALMDACFGIELYKRIPDGTPHMYTVSRWLHILLSGSSGTPGRTETTSSRKYAPPSIATCRSAILQTTWV